MKLTIFFSWQSPTNAQGFNNRKFLKECIHSAANDIKDQGRLKGVDFELREGLGMVPGTPDVAQKMFEQIDNCDIFIGDFTIQTPEYNFFQRLAYKIRRQPLPRREPNSNVLSEFSRALKNDITFEEQCILLLNTVNGDPDKDAERINFDYRGRRHPITFFMDKHTTPESVKKVVVENLKTALQQSALAALENKGKKYAPFISWKKLSKDKNLSFGYVATDDLKDKCKTLLNNNSVIRLLGLSGMGKTRLVLEAFRGNDANLHFLYADCNKYEKGKVFEKLKVFFCEYKEAFIVLDNCDMQFLEDVMDKRREYGATNPMIAVYYDPREESIGGTNQMILHRAEDDCVVQTILSRINNLSEDKRAEVEAFASGNPKMAELLVEGIRDGKELGNIGENGIMTKLLQTGENSKERVFLRTLSLFRYVGYKEERRSELEAVIQSKNITSVDYTDAGVLMNDCDATINAYRKREILEERGRLIGVRPLPLAFKLAREWLKDCTKERMLRVIDDLRHMKDPQALVRSFHDQFRNLQFVDEARTMLDQLLSHPSPFESAEVINTEVGSQLFRTFVEVNPVAVADLLYRVLSPLSIEDLKGIVEGRRNLVWTVEKLCFDSRTFWQGACLMMRLGVAENEAWSNNASADFASLFPIILPATSADLNTRLAFLGENINNKENKPLIFKALWSALQVRGFIYMSGAEEQGTKKLENYRPKSYDEIRTYFTGCLNLVRNEIEENGECKSAALDILEKVTPDLCRDGYACIVLPVVCKAAELLGWDWDKMQESMLTFKGSVLSILGDADKELYNNILERLTKHDIVSEFRAVQKDSYATFHGKDFNEREKESQQRYAKLAETFAAAYNKADLEGLMVSENLLIHPFGSRLYELMDDAQKQTFVADSVTILNANPQAKTTILLDFFGAGKEADVDGFAPVLRKLFKKEIIFETYGRLNVGVGSPSFIELTDMVREGKVSVTAFNKYWINLPLVTQTLEQRIAFFKVVLSFPDGLPVVMHMATFMTLDKTAKPANDLIKLLVSAIENYHSESMPVLQVDGVPMIATNILNNYKLDDFATFMHHELIVYLGKTDNVIINNYDISQLYEVLIDKYFDVIWPELSAGIVSDDILLFLHISEIVGTMMSNDEPGLLFKSDHQPECMKLCEDYPSAAPVRIIHMAPPYGQDGLSDLVMDILEHYGDQDGVLDELSAKLGSFLSSGSVIPNLEQQRDALSPLQYSGNGKVAAWAKREILSLDMQITKWRTIEEEPLM